jgi:two-component system chemotaxis response regulator CheY
MKVLVVDDDVVSRMMLMHMIDSAGSYDVLEAEDGEEAWRQLDAGTRPALLFCDLRMPRLSGMELLARVKADARFAGLPFVLVSAAADGDTMEQAIGLGADGYIVKPFAAGQVRAQLARLTQADDAPSSVAQRLGVTPERLLVYLGGLQRQLEEAGPALAAASPAQERTTRLQRLAEGCATLGLADSAARLRAAAQDDAEAVRAALEHALAAAGRQLARAQTAA